MIKCNLIKILRSGPETRKNKLTVEFVSVRSVFCPVRGANGGPEASESPSPTFTPCRGGKMMKCNSVRILRSGPESRKMELTVEFGSARSVFCLVHGADGGPQASEMPRPCPAACARPKMIKCNSVRILRFEPGSRKMKRTVEFFSVRNVFCLALGANGGPESAGKPEFVSSCAVWRGATIQVTVS